MADDTWYKLAPEVHAEIMSDRALVISFQSGRYYTIRDAGVVLIEGLKKGPVSESLARASWIESDPAEFEEALHAFMVVLVEEQIVVKVDPQPPGDLTIDRLRKPESFSFTPLEVETHLSDLLRLDPIHEIGPGGWPSVP